MLKISVGIVGGGVVGGSTARAFVEHVQEIRIYDSVPERRTVDNVWDALACDVVFVCLPTPQKNDAMECNTSILEQFFEEVDGYEGNLVLRSTVPVGFTRRMREKYSVKNLVHSPEFLTARCADVNAQCPARNVIGGHRYTYDGRALWCLAADILRKLYLDRWPHVPCYVMTSDESEAGKLGLNSFFATKVAFFNELHTFCQAKGLDWYNVIQVILSDGRVHPCHTQVPGHDGKFGYGGACLPKDLASFVHQMREEYYKDPTPGNGGLYPYVANAAMIRNKEDRKRGEQ